MKMKKEGAEVNNDSSFSYIHAAIHPFIFFIDLYVKFAINISSISFHDGNSPLTRPSYLASERERWGGGRKRYRETLSLKFSVSSIIVDDLNNGCSSLTLLLPERGRDGGKGVKSTQRKSMSGFTGNTRKVPNSLIIMVEKGRDWNLCFVY